MSLLKEIKAGRGEKARELLSSGGADVKEVEAGSGRSLLHLCVEREENELLEKLLKSEDHAQRPDLSIRDKTGEVKSQDRSFFGH